MKTKTIHIGSLGCTLAVLALLAACSKDPSPAPAPVAVPPTTSATPPSGAAAAGAPVPAAPGANPTTPDANTVGGVSFVAPNAQTSSHPLYVQPKEPVLQTDGSLRAAFEATFR